MRKLALVGLLALTACQPSFQTAGIDPHVAARCKLLAVAEPDRTVYTYSVTGSLLLSSALNSSKEEQIYKACVEAGGP